MAELVSKSASLDAGQVAVATRAIARAELTPAGKPRPGSGQSLPVVATQKIDLQAIAKKLNVSSLSTGRDLRFKVDLGNGTAVLQVVNRETGEIIRQIPPEKIVLALRENGILHMRLLDELA